MATTRHHSTRTNTPSYYPPGFTYSQLVEKGPETDSITDEQWKAFADGLEADKGPEALSEYRVESYNAWVRRTQQHTDEPEQDSEPMPCVEALCKMQGQPPPEPGEKPDIPEWGFVVFRTAGYGDDGQWEDAKSKWDECIFAQFDSYIDRAAPGAREAEKKFKPQWIEGSEYSGMPVAQLAEKYRDMKRDLPVPIDHSLFLWVDEQSLNNLVEAPGPLDDQGDLIARSTVPFVKAVAAKVGMEDWEDGKDWRGYWNVAVESLVNELFPTVGNQMLGPREIGVNVRDNEIWLDVGGKRKVEK